MAGLHNEVPLAYGVAVAEGAMPLMAQVPYVADGPADDAAWVGVLYESSEWSDFKLAAELAAREVPVRMIDMERPDAVEAALACQLLVSRVFASALSRGHRASHVHMAEVVRRAEELGIPLINAGRAHAFEVSKRAATEELARTGIAVPAMWVGWGRVRFNPFAGEIGCPPFRPRARM